MTVCQVTRNDAYERLKAMLAGKPDPNLGIQATRPSTDGGAADADATSEGPVNLEEQAVDQIRRTVAH